MGTLAGNSPVFYRTRYFCSGEVGHYHLKEEYLENLALRFHGVL